MPTHGQHGEANSDEGQRQCPLQERRTGKGPPALRLPEQGTRHVLREAGGSADYLWRQKMHFPTARTRRRAGALRKNKEERAAGVTRHPGTGLGLKITTTTKWTPATLGDATKRHASNSFEERARNYAKWKLSFKLIWKRNYRSTLGNCPQTSKSLDLKQILGLKTPSLAYWNGNGIITPPDILKMLMYTFLKLIII